MQLGAYLRLRKICRNPNLGHLSLTSAADSEWVGLQEINVLVRSASSKPSPCVHFQVEQFPPVAPAIRSPLPSLLNVENRPNRCTHSTDPDGFAPTLSTTTAPARAHSHN